MFRLTRWIPQSNARIEVQYAVLVCAIALAYGCSGCFSASKGDRPKQGQALLERPEITIPTGEILRRWQNSAKLVEVRDPLYEAVKKFNAISLAEVLLGIGCTNTHFELHLRCQDGYFARVSGGEALDGTAYLAFGDETSPGGVGFSPLKTKSGSVDPGPLYLFWRNDPGSRPHPYQVAEIQICSSAETFARARPSASTAAQAGFELFKKGCSPCHAVNGAGGRVAVDLNVPMNVTEYWREPALKRLLWDPAAIRANTKMPALHLSEADVQKVIAYLKDMRARKMTE